MSGHSKWSTIKHHKQAADRKKGAVFTKLGNAITLATKHGGPDPEMNFQLRLAIDKAKSANMPKDNIERAIKRGSGESGGVEIEEVIYEGLLPGNVAIIIQAVTDNKNRTLTDIKTALAKSGGQLVSQNAVRWHFKQKGVITINRQQLTHAKADELELNLIDWGAEDMERHNDQLIIYTPVTTLPQIRQNLIKANISIQSAHIEFVAQDKLQVDQESQNKIEKLFQTLDSLNDVSDYYTNLK